jgi:hypothetical protein
MSVLRQNATNDEFKKILRTRIKDASKQYFHGVVPVSCGDIRALAATENGDQRRRGDRFYCVLDTDMDGLPHHADVFATVPRPHESKNAKAAWRMERARLLTLMMQDFSPPHIFREGALNGSSGNGRGGHAT